MSILRDKFVGLAAPVMAATMAFSAPAWAEGNPANNNAPVTNASMSIGHNPTGQELCLEWKEKAKQAFPVICALNDKEIVVQDVLENGSHNRFLVGVWGGNDDHRTEAIRVVNRMYRDGKKVGIVFGPDRDTYLEEKFRGLDAEFEPFAHGQNASQGTSTIGLDNLHMISGELEGMFNRSYDANFPQKFASNTSYGSGQTPK